MREKENRDIKFRIELYKRADDGEMIIRNEEEKCV